MNNQYINVEISLNADGSLQISKPRLNKYYLWSLENRKDNEEINDLFKKLSKQKIIRCYEKDDSRILFIENKKNTTYKVIINDYDRLYHIIRFDSLHNKMNQFWVKKAFEKLSVKVKNVFTTLPTKYIIAGSILTTSIVIPQVIAINNNSTNNIVANTMNELNTTSNNEIEEIIIDEKDENISVEVKDAIEILDIDENIKEEKNEINNKIDYNDLCNLNSTDEYITFACKLFEVDTETAYQLLQDKIGNMEYYINNSSSSELKQLYELHSLGIINGNLDVIGSFVIIKNYANNNLNINNQEPIISNKSTSDKEKDLINIAKYIYGIDNKEMLSTIIATYRLETGYGTSAYALKLNNLGGNMNFNPSQEQINRFIRIIEPKSLNTDETPIPNIYKNVELGEESMVRNFLNVYAKCLHDEVCQSKTDLASFLSTKYCTHTPDAWAKTINELLNDGSIQDTVETYLGENNKKMY